MRGIKRDYETDFLTVLKSGPKTARELRKAIGGQENKYYAILAELVEVGKILKYPTTTSRAVFSLNIQNN